MERRIYHGASGLVALSMPIREQLAQRAPGKSMALIPNLADTDFFKPAGKDGRRETSMGLSGKFVISYFGAIGLANGLEFFLSCANFAQNSALPVHFILCGEGARLPDLKADATKNDLRNLTILPFTNREGIRQLMNVTDACFVSYLNVPILETGSPHKYFDGLAAGKLMLINVGGWMKDELEEERCGISIRCAEDFTKQIEPFLSDPEYLKGYQERARILAEKKYNRENLSGRWVNFLINQS